MDAGKLNRRVVIERPDESRDADFGQAVATWVPLATVWAAVEPINGREFVANLQNQSELSVRVRIRYRAGLTPKMRVNYGGRLLQIQAVLDLDEAHDELHLMCNEYREDRGG